MAMSLGFHTNFSDRAWDIQASAIGQLGSGQSSAIGGFDWCVNSRAIASGVATSDYPALGPEFIPGSRSLWLSRQCVGWPICRVSAPPLKLGLHGSAKRYYVTSMVA
ncbi:MAG: hypothetical protein AAFW95_16175 [Cyanobacteria bacterium J06638_6]